jgi:hypothetical protein
VIEANSNLEDALVEVADWIRLSDPDRLQGLVLLPELAAVELLDAVKQRGRWRILAARAGASRCLSRCGHADWAVCVALADVPSGEAAGSSR